jgi:cytochrome c oxidase assembly factor CtaG
VVVSIPPVGTYARRYDWVEAVQFATLALLAPAVLVAGGPWAGLGVAGWAESVTAKRRRHPGLLRSALAAAPAVALWVLWRTPAAVNGLHRTRWLLGAEAVTLLAAGVVLWLEVFSSPPFVPRSARPVRIALAALAMWTMWVLAYLVAMSGHPWYRSYPHPAGALGVLADQQLAAAAIWVVAAGCFLPLLFWNLIMWLRAEADPDEELHRLLREERRRAVAPPRRDT